MNITINACTLCTLCGTHFTLKGAQALCDYFEKWEFTTPMTIGDLCLEYAEVPQTWAEEYEDEEIIEWLDNGNILVANF